MGLPVHVPSTPTQCFSTTSSPLQVDSPESSENLAKKLKPSQKDEEEEEKERVAVTEQLNREGETPIQSVPYVLSSVVMHSGMSSESGHYYSYGRNIRGADGTQHAANHFALNNCGNGKAECSLSTCSAPLVAPEQGETVLNNGQESKDWLLFNDSRVTFTSFQSVQNITNRFPKDTAYVLMYRKQEIPGQDLNGGLMANGARLSAEPPLQKELLDAIIKDNKLYLQVTGSKQNKTFFDTQTVLAYTSYQINASQA